MTQFSGELLRDSNGLPVALEQVVTGLNGLRRSDFCIAGRSGAKRVSGNTGEPCDEPTGKKRPALRVARGRAPGSLRRSSDVPASTFAPRLPDRRAGAQRKLIQSGHNLLWARAPHGASLSTSS